MAISEALALVLLLASAGASGGETPKQGLLRRAQNIKLPSYFAVSGVISGEGNHAIWILNVMPPSQQQPWTEVWSVESRTGRLRMLVKACKRLLDGEGKVLRDGYADYVRCVAIIGRRSYVFQINPPNGDGQVGPWPDYYRFDSAKNTLTRVTNDGEEGPKRFLGFLPKDRLLVYGILPKPSAPDWKWPRTVRWVDPVTGAGGDWRADEQGIHVNAAVAQWVRGHPLTLVGNSDLSWAKGHCPWRITIRWYPCGRQRAILERCSGSGWPRIIALPQPGRFVVSYDKSCELVDDTSGFRIGLGAHIESTKDEPMRVVGHCHNGRELILARNDKHGYTKSLWTLDLAKVFNLVGALK